MVLVVEDHLELRHVLMDALDWEGYETVAANDVAAAAEVLRNHPIDLMVSDPTPFDEDDGALARIEAEFPDLAVIALEDKEDSVGIYLGPWARVGNRWTLRRPFRLQDLLAACRDALGPMEEAEEGED